MINLASLRRAVKILHDEYHVPNVVISSIPLRQWLVDALPRRLQPPPGEHDPDVDYLLCIVSSTETHPQSDAPSSVHTRIIPCIPGYFSGVGDLFSALVLAHYEPTPSSTPPSTPAPALQNHYTNGFTHSTSLSRAVSQALTKTHAILTLTHEHAKTLPEEDRQPTDEELDASEPDRQVRRMKGRELKLIQGQDILRRMDAMDSARMDPWLDFWEI